MEYYSNEQHYNKLRVCEVTRHAAIAGTERHVYLLACSINKDIFDTTVCTFERGELVNTLRDKGIKTSVVSERNHVKHFVKLVSFFVKSNFNVVHSHSGGYACLAAKIAGSKYIIYTKHGIGFTAEELSRRSFLRKLRDGIVDYCVTRYIALTYYDKYVMTKVLRVKAEKVRVIHNGIDPLYGVRTSGLSVTGRPVIGTVARLVRQKGIRFLIEAAAKIKQRCPNVKILIVGGGTEEASLRDLVRKMELDEQIRFLGYMRDSARAIKAMDVFVLPSVWEGFPYVLLEAMMLKKPIVATDIFGVNEIIKHNESGILVQPSNPDAISNAVIELCFNRKKARTLGDCAHRTVTKNFLLDKTVSGVENLYISLIS